MGLQFSECQQKWKIGVGHHEKLENGSSSTKMSPKAKLPIADPPKVWVSLKLTKPSFYPMSHLRVVLYFLIFCQVLKSLIPQLGDGLIKNELDLMRFKFFEVKFDLTYECHQNSSKRCFINILKCFGECQI